MVEMEPKNRCLHLITKNILYNTLFSREENFAKSVFEIFSREDIFANIGEARAIWDAGHYGK